ncbi:MAG: ATP-dependent DNA helicase RecG [Firmicutes bacterium]|nr:ATP-dependent DNA helicase RecG [Bacillota bacterium]
MKLSDTVDTISGVGPKKQQALSRMGIETMQDLLYLFPREYQDRSTCSRISGLTDGISVLIRGRVMLSSLTGSPYRRKQTLRLLVSDVTVEEESGSADRENMIEVIFFNAKFIAKSIRKGEVYDFYGPVRITNGKKQMVHPEFSESGKEDMEGIVPVYPLTAGISQRDIRKWQRLLKSEITDEDMAEEVIPGKLLEENNICGINYALSNIHFPGNGQKLKEARYRLIYEELLVMQTGLMQARSRNLAETNECKTDPETDIWEYTEVFPYELTNAQKRVIAEIDKDMMSERTMNRLVQGDVGSGKTAVAEAALYKTVKSGYQGAMMAPTEILARQHYRGLSENLGSFGIRVGLLTGSMKASEKKQMLSDIAAGEIDVVVGTHAIIQPEVVFEKLALVITDEQHRFGVNQREAFRNKGSMPHVLVMTATPIPRTLAVVIYGDLDVSVIDEMPPGRPEIQTIPCDDKRRDRMYDFVRDQIKAGRQAYVVAPLISESEELDALSAEELYDDLKTRFKGFSVELIHGEMKPAEKDAVMERFYAGNIDVLVSTVVIEVGIDVPNATVMVIEDSERFGLAQLHQLRGRIGRGKEKSYCILLNRGSSKIAEERTRIMKESRDGFYIAEEDLKLRGPGELFGLKQHGIPDLHMADLIKHIGVLDKVRDDARGLLEEDPDLKSSENEKLGQRIKSMFGGEASLRI